MKNTVRIGLVLLLCSFGWAQSAVPGTFSTQNMPPSAMVAGPLLTPPSVSFGSGQTSQGQTMMLGAQQSYSGYVSPVNGYVPMPTRAVVPLASATNTTASESVASNARFDFVVAPSGTGNLGQVSDSGLGDTNLGQLAASLRKGPPPTQRKFTNDDIARMNGVSGNNYQMPGASTTQPPYPQQQQAQPPQPKPHSEIRGAPLPPGTKPSPFSPRPAAQGVQQTASDQ